MSQRRPHLPFTAARVASRVRDQAYEYWFVEGQGFVYAFDMRGCRIHQCVCLGATQSLSISQPQEGQISAIYRSPHPFSRDLIVCLRCLAKTVLFFLSPMPRDRVDAHHRKDGKQDVYVVIMSVPALLRGFSS